MVRPVLLAISAFVLFSADAFARTCSEELAACRNRCGTSHGYTGDQLKNCVNTGCMAGFGQCMQRGYWIIGKTGQKISPLEKK